MKEHQDAVSTSNEFLGPDFETKLRAAREAEDAANENLVTLRKKISTIEQNRGLLELDDRDPEKEIRALRADVRNAEGTIQRSRQETLRILFEGRKQHDEVKATLWVKIHGEIISPYTASLKRLRAQLDSAIADVIRLMASQEDVSSTVVAGLPQEIGGFDAATVEFNRLATEFKASGQIPVPENEFLCVQISETLARHSRENLDFKKISAMLAATSSPAAAKKFLNESSAGVK